MSAIVEEIADVLAERGEYRHVVKPLRIADIEFQFDAVLVGPNGSDDIVVVVNLQEVSSTALSRRIRGLVTVLDRLQSRRSVSVVLIVRSDFRFDVSGLDKYCHVVVVRPGKPLESSLRTLLPLVLPEPSALHVNAEAALRHEMGLELQSEFVNKVIAAARSGSDDVRTIFEHELASIVASIEGGSHDR